MDVSICITGYKAKDFFEQSLSSVYVNPPSGKFEVIAVNDYSGDSTAEMITEKFSQVIFFENPERVGITKAHNRAFRAAQGRYIIQMGVDAVMLPGTLDKMVEFMDAHPEAGMVGCKILNPDGTLQPSGRKFPTLRRLFWEKMVRWFNPKADIYTQKYRNYDAVEEVDELCDACLIIRREVLEQVGLLDENIFLFYNDIDWCYRIKQAGWKIFYMPHAQVLHYGGCSYKNPSRRFFVEGY